MICAGDWSTLAVLLTVDPLGGQIEMPYFTDTAEAEKYIGQVFTMAIADPEIGPKLKAADVTLGINMTKPDARVYVDYGAGQVYRADTEHKADVEMYMEADVAQRFWLGKVNVAAALARGQMRAKGPVPKILKLVPLVKPIFPKYQLMLEEEGRQDLLVV